MSFNINQIKEGYGSAILEWGDYPGNFDPHQCGSAPFHPQIMPNGRQNSCASYCDGFDKKGCNKYLPNYPDDYYLLNYTATHGNCDGFNDCKRGITPIPHPDRNCGYDHTNVIENFGMPQSPLGIALYFLVFYLIFKAIFCKK